MSRKGWIACAAAYGLIAVVTFGHCAAESDRWTEAKYAECRAEAVANPKKYCARESWAPIAGVIAAVLWPLYWSWEVFE